MGKSKEEMLAIALDRCSKRETRLMFEYKRMFDIACCLIDDEDRRFLFTNACSEGLRYSVGMSMDDIFNYIKRGLECNLDE